MKSGLVLAGAGALAVVLLAGLGRSPKRPAADATGRMPEVLVTASGPRMVLQEINVRGERSPRLAVAVPGTAAIN